MPSYHSSAQRYAATCSAIAHAEEDETFAGDPDDLLANSCQRIEVATGFSAALATTSRQLTDLLGTEAASPDRASSANRAALAAKKAEGVALISGQAPSPADLDTVHE